MRRLITWIIFITLSRHVNTIGFRDDYHLLDDSFFKYHESILDWTVAEEVCENEGAFLFYPKSHEELQTMGQKWLTNLTADIHLGASDLKGSGSFITVHGDPFTLVNNTKTGTPMCILLSPNMKMTVSDCGRKTRFICQKPAASLKWNNDCNIPVYKSRDGYDYEFSAKLKKCYKLHTVARTWREALYVCGDEQAALAELNSQEEADYVVELVSRLPEDNVSVVCLGFELRPDGWKTLSNKLLSESGYPMWAHTQPDGGLDEPCGAMAYNGRLHDIASNRQCLFICERDIGQ